MLKKVLVLLEEVDVFIPKNKKELESFRIHYLGKKGVLNQLFADFKSVSKEDKKEFGQKLNALKTSVQNKINKHFNSFEEKKEISLVDCSRPSGTSSLGARHPISVVKNEIISVFSKIGFSLSGGPVRGAKLKKICIYHEYPTKDGKDFHIIDLTEFIKTGDRSNFIEIQPNSEEKMITILPIFGI